MITKIENVDLSVSTMVNALPTGNRKAVGRLHLSDDLSCASFHEEEGTVICGEAKSRRLFSAPSCSVWYNPEKDLYKIRLQVTPNAGGLLLSEIDFEHCSNFIRRKLYEKGAL